MKNYRIGKDISFVWKNVTLQGEPITSKENLTLEIHKATGRDLCCNRLIFDVIDGNIVATWLGVYQKELGEYSLTLWANKGKVGESALDSDSVVNLVKSTTLEGGDDSSIETETIDIEGDNIAFAVIKGDKGEDAKINGQNTITIDGEPVVQEGNELHINAYNKEHIDALDAQNIKIPSVTNVGDANIIQKEGYAHTTPDTWNLPQELEGDDLWGVLFTSFESADNGTGWQMYVGIDGAHKGNVYVRTMLNSKNAYASFSEWKRLATTADFEQYATKVSVEALANIVNQVKAVAESAQQKANELETTKQATLVSGSNIKTINGKSLLGSGDIEVVTDLSNYYNKPQVDEKVASLRVLSVDENDKISKYASSLIEISELYTLVNITGRNNDRIEMLATILPSTDTDTGWLYEYLEGWRLCKVSDYEFTANSTFANLCAFLDAHSSKLVTKTLTGEPANLTTTEKTNIVGAINEVNGKFSNYYSKTEADAKFADKDDTKTELERLAEKDEYLDEVVHDLTGEVDDLALKVDGLEPFVVEYGVTPYADIFNAFQAHRRCICYNFGVNKATCELCSYMESLNRLYFSCLDSSASAIYAFHVNNNNVYTVINGSIEMLSRKTQSITSASTAMQYPSAKAVYDYVEGKGGTPSGDPMHYAYEMLGATWNAQTGYWEWCRLTDLTNDDMRKCYQYAPLGALSQTGMSYVMGRALCRAIKIEQMTGATTLTSWFRANILVESIDLNATRPSGIATAFNSCGRLIYIYGLNLVYVTAAQSLPFAGCAKLEGVEISNIKVSLSFSDSPLLSAESVHYMIANAANTAAITITLHADAKARWMASEYYAEDSQTIVTKNITIA